MALDAEIISQTLNLSADTQPSARALAEFRTGARLASERIGEQARRIEAEHRARIAKITDQALLRSVLAD